MLEMIKKYCIYIIAFLTIIIIGGIVHFVNEDKIVEVETPILETNNEEDMEFFYVDIKGEVLNPGVYKIDSNLRLVDLVKKAGGLTKDADTSLLNLSKKVEDEMSIKIYSKKEVKDAKEKLKEEPTVIEIIKEIEKECVCQENNYACNKVIVDDSNIISNEDDNNINQEDNNELININTATKDVLLTLAGIGDSKAAAIIEYRETTIFNTIEDIKNVTGIGDSIFEQIKEYITV